MYNHMALGKWVLAINHVKAYVACPEHMHQRFKNRIQTFYYVLSQLLFAHDSTPNDLLERQAI
jgi:hypothetical protein